MMNIWRVCNSAGRRKYELGSIKYEIDSLQFILHTSYFLIFFLLTACAGVDPVIKIGLVGPFEGADRAVGYDVIYSARLAVREMNAAGGIAGYRVSLVALDDSGDVGLARETAVSLTLDPSVVAVVGHWTPDTTNAALPVYAEAGLPFIAAGDGVFGTAVPAQYPAEFREAYESVTPFNESPGPYAAPAYDAFQLLREALETAGENGTLTREGVALALRGLEVEGITGVVYQR